MQVADRKVSDTLRARPVRSQGSHTTAAAAASRSRNRSACPPPLPTGICSKDSALACFLVKPPRRRGGYVAANYYDASSKENNANFGKKSMRFKKAAGSCWEPRTA